ncbi:MAG: hypothetical protein IBX55_19570 [Methyloprofundus sp.]|nr:hypothetical protein [Methyloprofundus sp.]
MAGIILFFFVFGIPFSFLPVNSSKIALLVLLFISFLLFLQGKINFNLNISFIYFASVLLFLSIVSLVITIFHAAYDYSVSYAYMIFSLEALLGSYILYKIFLHKYNFKNILHLFIVVSLIQALVILAMFISEPVRDFIFSLTESKEELMERYGGFRGFGLAGSVTYDLAVFLSISLIFISYMVLEAKKVSTFYIFSWVVIAAAVLMTGRSGWIGIVFSLIFLALNLPAKYTAGKMLLTLSTLIIALSFSLVIYLLIYKTELYEILFLKIIPYAFEMFINFYQTGSFSTASSDFLSGMYFVASEKTILIGDGFWKNPYGFGYYMSTDAGYMRHLLFYGVFFSLILYMVYLIGFYKILKCLPKTKNNIYLIGMITIFFFVAHYKGDFLLGSAMNIKLFTILLVYAIWNKYEKNTLYRQHP